MLNRLLWLLKLFLVFVVLFLLEKMAFILWHYPLFANFSVQDLGRVLWHGLPLDFSLAGYLCVLPSLWCIVSVWIAKNSMRRIIQAYFVFVIPILVFVFALNTLLYAYWLFPLDTTPFFYFFSSTKDAFASATNGEICIGVALFLFVTILLFYVVAKLFLRQIPFEKPKRSFCSALALILFLLVLILPIRGGLTVSTMNTGKAYFSKYNVLNHAAVNPLFSLLESATKHNDFGSQYRYFSEEEATRLFLSRLNERAAPTRGILHTKRPHVLLIILESFSSHLFSSLGAKVGNVVPQLDSVAREGLLFTNFYANSFRTDRGLVSILSAYPAQPTNSVMKHPRIAQQLPSISGSLRKIGYHTHYYYGGDADFTNMRSYLVSSDIDKLIEDKSFPLTERLSKWGVPDGVLFKRVATDWNKITRERSFVIVQTSSSHEPFDVPYQRLANKKLNAFAYTDAVVGDFLRQIRQSKAWEETLVILVPDHMGVFPEHIDNLSVARYKIPLIMTGGALSLRGKIATIGSQIDLAATLLAQLGVDYRAFRFSKNMLSTSPNAFAFFTHPDAFGMVRPAGSVVYDNVAQQVVEAYGDTTFLESEGKAFLQTIYNDLDQR